MHTIEALNDPLVSAFALFTPFSGRMHHRPSLYIFFSSLLFAQESLYWEVADPIVNSEFIEAYINRLIEVDKFEENTIQASFSIIVQMDISDDEIELKKLKAKDYQMGQYISFDMSEMEADHIRAWFDNGETIAENCQMLCRECHYRKTAEQTKTLKARLSL